MLGGGWVYVGRMHDCKFGGGVASDQVHELEGPWRGGRACGVVSGEGWCWPICAQEEKKSVVK